jgi:hypothetical protein
MAQSPWYSVRLEDPFEKEADNRIRASAILIHTKGVVRLRSTDILLPGKHEAFRLSIDSQAVAVDMARTSYEICGSIGEWCSGLEVLPQPASISLVWNTYTYDRQEAAEPRTFEISVPDSLLIEGKRGRILVAQHQLPNWLAICSDGREIDAALSRATRIDRIP